MNFYGLPPKGDNFDVGIIQVKGANICDPPTKLLRGSFNDPNITKNKWSESIHPARITIMTLTFMGNDWESGMIGNL